eukprot:scaffold5160_cov107-Isochrysis_galbana.AAC.1
MLELKPPNLQQSRLWGLLRQCVCQGGTDLAATGALREVGMIWALHQLEHLHGLIGLLVIAVVDD